ncbi:MAG TPA: hypothetical protein VFO49_18880 [Nocardioides sp.]|nr:hypothetical protein [Nocardioides sp.]
MDLSALIFVALAVAWAVYLIPKALKHHEDAQQKRTVEGFSQSMRVLARREPVDARKAELKVEGRTPAPEPEAAPAVTRVAAARATKRRRRVLSLIVVANLAVAVAAFLGHLAWTVQAAPAGLLVAWLVACRLMVKKERATVAVRRAAPAEQPVAAEGPETEEIAAVAVAEREPGSWDPVPVTLPTYVDKAEAARSVRTIDLESTGVWSSGRSESDSALVREADEASRSAKAAEAAEAEERRAAGS